jgi:hypothetical protein
VGMDGNATLFHKNMRPLTIHSTSGDKWRIMFLDRDRRITHAQ